MATAASALLPLALTHGHLLGGRLRYAQPTHGYRTGIEPVLLAASVAARPGQRVLEAGTGAGAGLLCLAARVPGLTGLGLELDPAMAALARHNLAQNGIDSFAIAAEDVTGPAGAGLGGFDHAMANPPWHATGATRSPLPRRALAKQEVEDGLERWVESLRGALVPGGTLTLILAASQEVRARAAMTRSGLGELALLRLLPKPDRPAKIVLISARVAAPVAEIAAEQAFVLHEADGRYTEAAEAVLRRGAPLPG